MKKLSIIFVLAMLVASTAGATETKRIEMRLDCKPQLITRYLVIPEGRKAVNFRLIKYERGSACMPTFPEDNPRTEQIDENRDAIEKWERRDPVLYGWGIKNMQGGYFYSLRLLRGFRDKSFGKLGSLWLAPGKYIVELRGDRRDSSLSLSYQLEPYTAEGAKPPAAAAAAAAPAVTGTVERPHKPHPSGATETISGGKWAGTWYTHPGKIVLKQSGHHVSGTYTLQSGKVNGKVVGNTMVGTWSDGPTYKPPMDAGQIVYKMSADGKSFTVDFRGGYDKDNLPWFRNAWTATRSP